MGKVVGGFVRLWMVALTATSIYVFVLLRTAGGDPLVLVRIGTKFSDHDLDGSTGYDGQFYYHIARDLREGWRHVDVPAYRYQRIFFPLLARVLSLGDERLLPWTMLAINLVIIAGSVAIVEALLVERGVSRWYALSLGLYGGLLFGATASLAEPLALCLALGVMALFARRHPDWSACLFALAGLTKETMLLLAGGYVIYQFTQKQFRRGLVMGTVVAAPFVVWQLCLLAYFGVPAIGAGGTGASPFQVIPFGALVSVIHVGWVVFGFFALVLVPVIVVPTVWAIWATGQAILRGKMHPWTFALALFALVLPFLPASTFLDLTAMPRFACPLVALTVLFAAHNQSCSVLRASLLWMTTVVLVPFT